MANGGWVLVSALGAALLSAPANASCVVTNETAYAFVVESGNAPNQKVGAHATTTIEAGKISGKSAEGKTIAGTCKDGASLVVREKNGVPLLMPKPKKK
ncbi:MAG TPA: hypothetical protein VK989_19155 [Polyangia bacterium]|jgi:hypothetical protein|nr:hypothetical protein [Polyangia bacterium]